VLGCAILRASNWSRFSFSSGTSRFKRPSGTSAANSAFVPPSMTGSASNPKAEVPAQRPSSRPTVHYPANPCPNEADIGNYSCYRKAKALA
jgi:hypothetical protein